MAENRTEIKQREYLIGDMSEIVGVSRDTLRFYEKKGIIKARKKENGYRYYLEEDLFRLMVILYILQNSRLLCILRFLPGYHSFFSYIG